MKIYQLCLILVCIALIASKEIKKDNKLKRTELLQKEKSENKVKGCDCRNNEEKFLSSNTGCSSYKMGGCGKATCIHSDCNLDIATWKYNWDWEFSSKFFFIIYGSDIGSQSALEAQAKSLNMKVGDPISLQNAVGEGSSLDSLKSLVFNIKTSRTQELSQRTPVNAEGTLRYRTAAPVAVATPAQA